MIAYLLLLVSILLAVCKSSLYNTYAKKNSPTLPATFCFNTIAYGIAAAIGLIVLLFSEKTLSVSTVICALAYAIIVLSLQTVSITAMKAGAMSLVSICVMYGMMIPALAGPIFWKEPFGALQAIGICMMVVSLWLLRENTAKESKPTTKGWWLLAAIAFILSGMAGVMEKIHQSTDGRSEKAAFVCIACVCMLLFSTLARLLLNRKKAAAAKEKSPLILGGLSGIVIGFYSIVNLSLAGTLDSIIYFPVANGGAMLLTVIVAFAIFKEPLGLRKAIGILIGLCGIVCLSIPV